MCDAGSEAPRCCWCGVFLRSHMECSKLASPISVGSIVVRGSPTILAMASANVRTLQPQEPLKSRRAGLALYARMMFMDHQFHDAGFSLVFVQESCIAEASQRQQRHFVTFSSASTDAGQKLMPFSVSPRLFVDSPKMATWPAFVLMLRLPVLLPCGVDGFWNALGGATRQTVQCSHHLRRY